MKTANQEQIWVKQLTQDDEHAFCALYASYKNRLIYFALKMLKSSAYAEDVYQDTFTTVWNCRKRIDPDAPFGPFVYTIMRNRILNLLAELDTHQQIVDRIYRLATETNNPGNPTLAAVEQNEFLELYDKALQTLTPQQRRVFCLSREEMLSHKEIAARLNLSVSTVQQHLSAALRSLRTALAPHTGIGAELYLLLLLLNKLS